MPDREPITSRVRGAVGVAARRLPRRANDHDAAVGEPWMLGGKPIKPGEWTPDHLGLPPRCPVEPLGMCGELLAVQDALGQLHLVEPGKMGQKYIQMLFGARQNYLYWAWPRHNAKGAIVAWRAEKVAETLYTAGARRGVFDAANRVRGRGAWRDTEGGLVYHTGDGLWRMNAGVFEEASIGELEGNFYPRRPEIPQPWAESVREDANPCALLLPMLRRWKWERDKADPVLFLGWLCAALLGGALPWRPIVFVVGDKATGKSSLQTAAKAILGEALLSTADTTAAGIYQRVQRDSLAIAVDELEAESDSRKAMAVITLARLAASGNMMFRGGADHVATEFRAQSCFFFSSINPPPLMPQDVSRMAILRLRKLDADAYSRAVPTVVDPETCGPRLLRRLMDNWPRFDRVFAEYARVLRMGGHDGRGQDTFGVLLTCAHLAIGEDLADHLDLPMCDNLDPWAELLATRGMLEWETAAANWYGCIKYLLTSRVDAWRGGLRITVGQVLDDLARDWTRDPSAAAAEGQPYLALVDADRLLGQAGVAVMRPGELEGGHAENCGWVLGVPTESQLVNDLFKGTPWTGGVWTSALRQAPPEIVSIDPSRNKRRINGVAQRCTLIRLKAFGEYSG